MDHGICIKVTSTLLNEEMRGEVQNINGFAYFPFVLVLGVV